jgi:hypothetical protein
MTLQRNFTDQEILDGLEYINQTLIQHGLAPITLDQYKETLNHPISHEILPRNKIAK